MATSTLRVSEKYVSVTFCWTSSHSSKASQHIKHCLTHIFLGASVFCQIFLLLRTYVHSPVTPSVPLLPVLCFGSDAVTRLSFGHWTLSCCALLRPWNYLWRTNRNRLNAGWNSVARIRSRIVWEHMSTIHCLIKKGKQPEMDISAREKTEKLFLYWRIALPFHPILPHTLKPLRLRIRLVVLVWNAAIISAISCGSGSFCSLRLIPPFFFDTRENM